VNAMIDHGSQSPIQVTIIDSVTPLLLSRLGCLLASVGTTQQATLQVMPDDHSELVPPLPIPNRTVKRLCADDSAATSVKVGHRQAVIENPSSSNAGGVLLSISVRLSFKD
jgi:hypothetical protein